MSLYDTWLLALAFLVTSDPARDVPVGGFLKQERPQFRKGGLLRKWL